MKDIRLVDLRRVIHAHPARSAMRDDETREAAVALIVRPRAELELLLIKRATHERDPWSGHMALPGGRREQADPDLIATAIRETREEVGITLQREMDFVGALDELYPKNKRLPPLLIAPFVFEVAPDTQTTANSAEVEAAIWVPVSALRDEQAASEILIELESGATSYPSLKYGEYVIWGLTHRILVQFLELT